MAYAVSNANLLFASDRHARCNNIGLQFVRVSGNDQKAVFTSVITSKTSKFIGVIAVNNEQRPNF